MCYQLILLTAEVFLNILASRVSHQCDCWPACPSQLRCGLRAEAEAEAAAAAVVGIEVDTEVGTAACTEAEAEA